MRSSAGLMAAVLLTACGGTPLMTADAGSGEEDAGATFDAGSTEDAGSSDDAGSIDAGADDAGAEDAGVDAGPIDAGPLTFCDALTCLSPSGETCWSCWSDKPDAGADILIPQASRILLDEPIDVGHLLVQGALTTAPVPLTVKSTGIDIQGSWSAGTALVPHPAPLRVSLHGATRLVRVTLGGALSLRGPTPTPFFTSLAGAADAGSTQLPLASLIDWQAGDEVLITPSGHYAGSPAGNFTFPDAGRGATDYAVLTSVSASGVTLDRPLSSNRYDVLDAGGPIDLRAEIANLTRGIVIEGADDAEWDAGLGVRIQAEGPSAGLVLEGVRVDRGGAALELRGAALSVHLVNPDAGALLRGNVVTRTASRGLEIDLTDGVQITGNVFAGLRGHGMWLTSGLERDTLIDGNLVTDLREPRAANGSNASEFSTLPYSGFDRGFCGASAFVIANPDNVLRRNVASDLPGCGFWLSFASRTRGLAAGVDLAPNRVPFGTFEDNRSHSTGGPGVMLRSAIVTNAQGDENTDEVRYEPQLDSRASVGRDGASTLGATLTRTTVLGAQLSSARLAGRIKLEAPVMWSSASIMLATNGGSRLVVEDGLFVGQLGPATQPLRAPPLLFASAYDSLVFTRTRLAHFPAHPTQRWGGVLFTYDFPLFGFDLTLENWTQMDFTEVELGVRMPTPANEYDVTGPILDSAGVGGFPGRWWVTDVPYFTQGNVCSPAARGPGSSGQLCASSGYFGLADIQGGTGTGTTTPLAPEAELVRVISGSPSVGFHAAASLIPSGRSRGLPVPVGETVELRLPGYPVPPRRLKLHTWGREGQQAVLRIPYPAGTTFVITTAFEHYAALAPGPVTFTPAASLAELTSDPVGTRYFFSGGYLHLSLRSLFRGRLLGPYALDPILITATGTGLP